MNKTDKTDRHRKTGLLLPEGKRGKEVDKKW